MFITLKTNFRGIFVAEMNDNESIRNERSRWPIENKCQSHRMVSNKSGQCYFKNKTHFYFVNP